jgi:hypothetical protein
MYLGAHFIYRIASLVTEIYVSFAFSDLIPGIAQSINIKGKGKVVPVL